MGRPRDDQPEPVFAPEVPAKARELLLSHREAMIPAARPVPQPRSQLQFRLKPGETLGMLVAILAVDVIAVGVVGGLLRWLLPEGIDDWAFGAVGVLGLLGFAFMVLGACSIPVEIDAAIKNHGRYLQAADWDAEAQQLMRRAQHAVRTVVTSEVNRRGLLDDIQNHVVLPEQLWDIGQVLQKLTALRSRHRELDGAAASVLSETVTRQADALRRTEAAMERKIASLEKYAEQVRSADALLRAERAVEQLRKDDDAYVELLASAEPAAGTALVQDLSADAADLRRQLEQRLAVIRETGQALAPSPEA